MKLLLIAATLVALHPTSILAHSPVAPVKVPPRPYGGPDQPGHPIAPNAGVNAKSMFVPASPQFESIVFDENNRWTDPDTGVIFEIKSGEYEEGEIEFVTLGSKTHVNISTTNVQICTIDPPEGGALGFVHVMGNDNEVGVHTSGSTIVIVGNDNELTVAGDSNTVHVHGEDNNSAIDQQADDDPDSSDDETDASDDNKLNLPSPLNENTWFADPENPGEPTQNPLGSGNLITIGGEPAGPWY